MSYFCYECIAKKVNSGQVEPLFRVWGANNTPFMRGIPCALCGKIDSNDTVVMHPEMEKYLKESEKNNGI